MNTIFWHDYETFGADPRRDRPVQFAGVRTDEDLNVVADPVTVFCRPAPDYLPQPEACLITGITPQQALREGVSEAEFAARIHAELAVPGTCGAGYNSVRFDDEVTRYLLYRNFYEPYAREWQHGNSRWDIIDLTRMCYALRPDGIAWPRKEDGSPSFRLSDLTGANDLEHSAAHDALSDVYATIALAKKLRQAQPRLYDYLFKLRDKTEAARCLDLAARTPVLHTSGMFPAQHGRTAIVVPLAQDPYNKNAVIVFDLSADPAPLLELDAVALRERVFTAAADLPAGVERLPLKQVHLNKCPALAPLATLPADAGERLAIDRDEALRRFERLQQMPQAELTAKIRAVYQQKQDFPPAAEAEAALYEGFISNADKPKLDRVRALDPAELAAYQPKFQDSRLNELFFRYRARNYPETLNPAERETWETYRRRRLTDPEAGAALTAAAYFECIEKLRAETAAEQHGILDALEAYGRELTVFCG